MSGGARRVLVTGASAGIGRACAAELQAAGWSVTGASRRGTAPGGWTGLVMDVDDDDSVRVPRLRSRRPEQPGSLMTAPGSPRYCAPGRNSRAAA
jgi:NAD(P)-dependent dehydrogenase (short-subunit alcohol dehydrogenase family)